MNTTITNNGLPKFPQATSNPASSSSASATASADGTAAAPRTGDQLKLTDSAQALQMAARQQETPPVDTQRVEQLRRALADGSYQIDAGRIADRMIAMNQQLDGTGKA
ncbi:MAG TPA: flagellar biosynthesis anti-sigma factor FlgM [Rhodanobacter sp.]|nr:flagellar biosynthesis anti-sigma factor FlgM [Rhodanobacter sp.]